MKTQLVSVSEETSGTYCIHTEESCESGQQIVLVTEEASSVIQVLHREKKRGGNTVPSCLPLA